MGHTHHALVARQIEQMVRAAQTGGFNTLIVQVRGRGDAYYDSALEPARRNSWHGPGSIRSPNFWPAPSRLA